MAAEKQEPAKLQGARLGGGHNCPSEDSGSSPLQNHYFVLHAVHILAPHSLWRLRGAHVPVFSPLPGTQALPCTPCIFWTQVTGGGSGTIMAA